MRNTFLRCMRWAGLAAALSLPFGGLAWAQNYNDYNYHRADARGQGYHRGYDDGFRRGQNDLERGHRFKFKTDDWEDARGFERWMGDKRDYKYAYRDGYERGYREAFNNYGNRYRDRDDYRSRDRDDWR